MDCDPDFDKVVLLLHNDTFAFEDSSSYGHTVSLYSSSLDVGLDTTTKKFGAGSAYFPSGVSTITIPDAPEFDFSTGDWTVEVWPYLGSAHAGARRPIVEKRAATGGSDDNVFPYNIRIDEAGHLFASGTDASTFTVYNLDGGDISAHYNTWRHVALTRHGDVFTLWFNGNSVATATDSRVLSNNPYEVMIGGRKAVSDNFGAQIDEIRLTKGLARYTAPFMPPTAAFPDRLCQPNDLEPARWVKFGRAIRLPHVLGGDGKFQNERAAIKAFVAEAQGAAVFARYALDCPNNDGDIQVDITSAEVSAQPHDSTT